MAEERIRTLHPDPGKTGVNIDKQKYEVVRDTIIKVLSRQGSMSFSELGEAVASNLGEDFNGSPGWYYTTVKLDLEARGILERIQGQRPQLLRLSIDGQASSEI